MRRDAHEVQQGRRTCVHGGDSEGIGWGRPVEVLGDGVAVVTLDPLDALAIHVGSRLSR